MFITIQNQNRFTMFGWCFGTCYLPETIAEGATSLRELDISACLQDRRQIPKNGLGW